jgi:hypothetical protein
MRNLRILLIHLNLGTEINSITKGIQEKVIADLKEVKEMIISRLPIQIAQEAGLKRKILLKGVKISEVLKVGITETHHLKENLSQELIEIHQKRSLNREVLGIPLIENHEHLMPKVRDREVIVVKEDDHLIQEQKIVRRSLLEIQEEMVDQEKIITVLAIQKKKVVMERKFLNCVVVLKIKSSSSI